MLLRSWQWIAYKSFDVSIGGDLGQFCLIFRNYNTLSWTIYFSNVVSPGSDLVLPLLLIFMGHYHQRYLVFFCTSITWSPMMLFGVLLLPMIERVHSKFLSCIFYFNWAVVKSAHKSSQSYLQGIFKYSKDMSCWSQWSKIPVIMEREAFIIVHYGTIWILL